MKAPKNVVGVVEVGKVRDKVDNECIRWSDIEFAFCTVPGGSEGRDGVL